MTAALKDRTPAPLAWGAARLRVPSSRADHQGAGHQGRQVRNPIAYSLADVGMDEPMARAGEMVQAVCSRGCRNFIMAARSSTRTGAQW